MESLNSKVKQIENIINQRLYQVDIERFKRYVKALSVNIGKLKLEYTATVKINSKNCAKCGKQSKGVGPIDCHHHICSVHCLQKIMTEYHDMGMAWGDAYCPTCCSQISTKSLDQLFSGHQNYVSWVNSKSVPNFDCEICYTSYSMDQAITLDCNHRYCQECISNMLAALIKDSEIGENSLKCPNCNSAIDINIIQGNVSPEIFEKYNRFMINNWVPSPGETIFTCPGVDCENRVLIPEDLKSFNCAKCKLNCCPQCKEKPHKKYTCEEYAQWKRKNNKGEDEMEKLVRAEQLIKCPVCVAVCQKTEGCNFMTCSSGRCQKNTFFCYLCGSQLTVVFT